jgi:hypothetical protein
VLPQKAIAQQDSADHVLAVVSYLGVVLSAGSIVPLVIYFHGRLRSDFLREHAAQALNSTLTIGIYAMAALAHFSLSPVACLRPWWPQSSRRSQPSYVRYGRLSSPRESATSCPQPCASRWSTKPESELR